MVREGSGREGVLSDVVQKDFDPVDQQILLSDRMP